MCFKAFVHSKITAAIGLVLLVAMATMCSLGVLAPVTFVITLAGTAINTAVLLHVAWYEEIRQTSDEEDAEEGFEYSTLRDRELEDDCGCDRCLFGPPATVPEIKEEHLQALLRDVSRYL